MAKPESGFDPYFKWLGIRPKDQPPNHYRLLGVELFEADADVIATAADARMTHVKTFQTGEYSTVSQRILNEIAAAKVCLLNPQKRVQYDAALQAKLSALAPEGAADEPASAEAAVAAPPMAETIGTPAPLVLPDWNQETPLSSRSPTRYKRKKGPTGSLIVVGVVAAAVLVGLVVWLNQPSEEPRSQTTASREGQPRVSEGTKIEGHQPEPPGVGPRESHNPCESRPMEKPSRSRNPLSRRRCAG